MAIPQEDDSLLLRAASLELEAYLQSNVLFWRTSGLSIPLTPGNLLLSSKRTIGVTPENYGAIQDLIQSVLTRHRVSWRKKIKEEFQARLTQWENVLRDFHEDGFSPAEYSAQVRTRVILTLCDREAAYPDNFLETKLQFLDDRLRLLVQPGAFIWETALEDEFPANEYWYLYVTQKGN